MSDWGDDIRRRMEDKKAQDAAAQQRADLMADLTYPTIDELRFALQARVEETKSWKDRRDCHLGFHELNNVTFQVFNTNAQANRAVVEFIDASVPFIQITYPNVMCMGDETKQRFELVPYNSNKLCFRNKEQGVKLAPDLAEYILEPFILI